MYPINPDPLLRLTGCDPLLPMCNKKDGGDPPPPDPNIGLAALRNAEISREALDWYKGVYAQDAPYREEYRDIAKQIAETQIAAQEKNQQYADDYYGYMRDTFRPVEKGIVEDAQRYSSDAEKERLAAEAATDVAAAGANQRAQMSRQMAAMGVNPNSGRFQALQRDSNILEAATRAGSMIRARQQAEQQGWARRMDAASIGRNLPANQATSQGIAITAGNSALGAAGAPAQQSALYGTMMGQGYGTAIAGNQSTANILNAQYGNQLNAWSAQQQAAAQESAGMWSGIGTAAGMAAMAMMSSKKLKTQKKPIASALEGLRGVPVESWKYKEGVADEGRHVGAYAEDVNREFGDKAAPGGKMIDVISMLGINTAAIKELDAKVSRLEKRS